MNAPADGPARVHDTMRRIGWVVLVVLAVAAAVAFLLVNRSEPVATTGDAGPRTERGAPPDGTEDPLRTTLGGDAPERPGERPDPRPAPQQPPPPTLGPPRLTIQAPPDQALVTEIGELVGVQELEIGGERRMPTEPEAALVAGELELARRALHAAESAGTDVLAVLPIFEQLPTLVSAERLVRKVELREPGRADAGRIRIRRQDTGQGAQRFVVETARMQIELTLTQQAISYWKLPQGGEEFDWSAVLRR